jgi:hypothetical protein
MGHDDRRRGPGEAALPPHPAPRLPGERLLRRRAPMPDAGTASVHPGGLSVRRGAWTAVVLRGNAPAGALWLDPDGRWRAAAGAAAALAVSGEEADDDALWALEERAPAFRRFAAARDWLLAALGGDGAPGPSPGPDGPAGGHAARSGRGRRGEVIHLAGRRPPRRR